MLYKFGKKVFPPCSFCMEEPASPLHLFLFLHKNKLSLDAGTRFFPNELIIPPITPHSTISEFIDHKKLPFDNSYITYI